jgi:hypothetical protein
MKKIGRHIRGHFVAYLALFFALGGTSIAASNALGPNTVGATQLRKNAVTNPKIKANAVTGAKVKNNSLTGADVLESSLGKVPSAANADHATSADNATNATNATHATSADSATNASDSSKLGGVAAANYQRPGATLQSGQTEHGIFAGGGGTGDYLNIEIQFDPELPADLDTAHTILVTGASATHCPGTGQADPGYFCLYEKAKGNATFLNFGNPVAASQGASKEGENVFYTTSANLAYVYGEWAVTAP